MISLEKWMILTPLQKLTKNVGDLGKIIVAKSLNGCPKWKKSPDLAKLVMNDLFSHLLLPSNDKKLNLDNAKILLDLSERDFSLWTEYSKARNFGKLKDWSKTGKKCLVTFESLRSETFKFGKFWGL